MKFKGCRGSVIELYFTLADTKWPRHRSRGRQRRVVRSIIGTACEKDSARRTAQMGRPCSTTYRLISVATKTRERKRRTAANPVFCEPWLRDAAHPARPTPAYRRSRKPALIKILACQRMRSRRIPFIRIFPLHVPLFDFVISIIVDVKVLWVPGTGFLYRPGKVRRHAGVYYFRNCCVRSDYPG